MERQSWVKIFTFFATNAFGPVGTLFLAKKVERPLLSVYKER